MAHGDSKHFLAVVSFLARELLARYVIIRLKLTLWFSSLLLHGGFIEIIVRSLGTQPDDKCLLL